MFAGKNQTANYPAAWTQNDAKRAAEKGIITNTAEQVPKGAACGAPPSAKVLKSAASGSTEPTGSQAPPSVASSSQSAPVTPAPTPPDDQEPGGGPEEARPLPRLASNAAEESDDSVGHIGIVLIAGLPGSGARTASDGLRSFFEYHGYAVDTLWAGHFSQRARRCYICECNDDEFGAPQPVQNSWHAIPDVTETGDGANFCWCCPESVDIAALHRAIARSRRRLVNSRRYERSS
jgi:hypothetical protein